MRDPFARSFAGEVSAALFVGAIVTATVVAGLIFFMPSDQVLMAQNTAVTEPVTQDTPGPVIDESDVTGVRSQNNRAPLSDRDR
jgi:hypothetical protein